MGSFSETVLEIVKQIPKGRVMTYSGIAAAAGRPKACRSVGNALNSNPNPVIVPCHRVVRSDGALGGYSLGVLKKRRLLEKEGVVIENGRVDLEGFCAR